MCSCADPARDVDCDLVIAETAAPSAPRPSAPTPSAPMPSSPTPSTPTPPTTTSSSDDDDDEDNDVGNGAGVGVWVPRVGDTWQYNLNTPVDTSVKADVFFIDMGE